MSLRRWGQDRERHVCSVSSLDVDPFLTTFYLSLLLHFGESSEKIPKSLAWLLRPSCTISILYLQVLHPQIQPIMDQKYFLKSYFIADVYYVVKSMMVASVLNTYNLFLSLFLKPYNKTTI